MSINGGMLQNIGIEPGEVNDKAKAVGLDTYTQMLEEANKEQEPAKRYEKYAEVQAWLVDSALAIPNVSQVNTDLEKDSSILIAILTSRK